jgi:hypothetical protein
MAIYVTIKMQLITNSDFFSRLEVWRNLSPSDLLSVSPWWWGQCYNTMLVICHINCMCCKLVRVLLQRHDHDAAMYLISAANVCIHAADILVWVLQVVAFLHTYGISCWGYATLITKIIHFHLLFTHQREISYECKQNQEWGICYNGRTV